MPSKINCPSTSHPDWKKLVKSIGPERAYIAYFRNEGKIPDLEAARNHLITKPDGYKSPEPPKEEVPAITTPKSDTVPEVEPASAPEATVIPEPKVEPAIEPAKAFEGAGISETFEHKSPVIEGTPSLDFRTDERFGQLDPKQWVAQLKTSASAGVKGDASGNRATTRIGVALREPDGRVVLTGLVMPQRVLKSSGYHGYGEPALQRMGDGNTERVVATGGKTVAAVEDVVAAGMKPIAVIHFEGEPTKIFQTFKDEAAFDKAWGAADKTAGKNIQNRDDVFSTGQRTLAQTRARMEEIVNRLAEDMGDDERSRLFSEYERLQMDEDRLDRQQGGRSRRGPNNPQFRTREEEARAPIEADRTSQFQAAAGRMRSLGMKVDTFAKEFFAQGVTETVQQEIESLKQSMAQAASAPERDAIERKIILREQRLQELSANKIAGVTFNPWHIAISMDDVDKADMGGLVTLMHEAAEQLTMSLNVVMRGNVIRAIDESIDSLRAQAAAASEKTGVALAKSRGATDILAETLGQKLAARGVPDAPNLAQSLIRWFKDLYYRVVMAAQKSFGKEPSAEITLNWMENQLKRVVSGDYDYRLARVLDRFLKEPLVETARRFTGQSGTPGGLVDFLDPVEFKFRQPQVETTSTDAMQWNLEFRATGDDPGKELEIPQPEASARIEAAKLNSVLGSANEIKNSIAKDMPWEKFWKIIGRGEDPKLMLAEIEKRYPGSEKAVIGGERMTKPMNEQANLGARILVENGQRRILNEIAKSQRQIKESSDKLIERAREINRLEADLRNASLHEDILQAKIKDMAKSLVQDYRRGLDTAHTHGELAEAIRQSEGLLEADPIPENYQRVLKAVIDGEVPVFNYVKAIAGLDLNLLDMTTREVVKAIKDNAEANPDLRRLSENKPLSVALAVLARKNADQVDQIQLGWLRDMTQFNAIHDDLKSIKAATKSQLSEMLAKAKERASAKSLRDRINRSYLEKRRSLQSQSDRIKMHSERVALLENAKPIIAKKVEELQKDGSSAPSEWYPAEGAEWMAMSLQPDGRWISQKRVLRFNPDGSALNGAQIRGEIAENNFYLRQNKAKAGTKFYEQVKRQTLQLALLDVQRAYPAGWAGLLDRITAPVADQAAAIGGSASARIKQMMLNQQRINYFYWPEIEAGAHLWTNSFSAVEKASGVTDHGAFLSQIYDPVMYFLGVNPGLDEGPAIRQATKEARARLAQPPSEDFNAKFADFLRRTKENSERIVSIAEKEGAFVKDPRLKNELRRAVSQGWLTVMRGMRGNVVQTVIRDMDKAGWKLQYGPNDPAGSPVKAMTFDSIDPANAKSPEDSKQYWQAIGNDDAMRKMLAQYFTPSIVQNWLEPFVNKAGQSIFAWRGEPIPQMDVQGAWDDANNDVISFIDNLSKQVALTPDKSGADPRLEFRISLLKQIDKLFGMEAKLAYDASQTREMFDPMGPKPHVVMDARLNDLLPPEHLKFQTFDPEASRQLLAHVSFHAAFGRNGERMVATVNEMKSSLQSAKRDYDSLRGTTKQARMAEAGARGLNYKELEIKAQKYDDAVRLQQKLEGLFGVNNPAGPFHDMRTAMETVHTMAAEVVDNPKVGLYHVISLAERPFAMRSLGPMTIKYTAKAFSDFLKTGFGSFLEAFNIHLMHASAYEKEVGSVQGQAFRNLPWSVVLSDIGNRGRFQESKVDKWLIRPMRLLRYAQRKGVGRGDAQGEFPRMAPIPGMGSLNTTMQISATVNGATNVGMLENLVSRGIRYFNTHRDDFDNPSFRFTKAKELGMWRLDQGVLDWWRNKTVEYGLGNIEDIIRQAMPRAAKAERLFDRDQVLRMSMMANNELDGASSINTTPAVMQNNAALRLFMPLLRWPLWKMHQVHEGLMDAEGRASFAQAMKGIGTLALWNLPLGIAFTFMMDQYDEKLLHKKSNMRDVPGVAGVPIVGPAIALMEATDKPGGIPENILGFLERGAKAGNLYGLAADAVSQIFTSPDPNSGRRAFSLDQRVLVMSQLLNTMQAFDNLYHQKAATWSSFWRPFFSSLGGNGVLQAADITNNLLGLDNAESRLVSRINAQNWLRASGRELEMEMRQGNSSSSPTPMSVWTREMQMAAMANDRLGFLNNYNKAMEAAREAVGEDPRIPAEDRENEAQRRVLGSWRSRDPREVFRFKPTDAQMNQLYSVMDDSGKQDVRDAITRFENFSQLIEPSQSDRYVKAQERRLMSPARARRQGAGLLFSH